MTSGDTHFGQSTQIMAYPLSQERVPENNRASASQGANVTQSSPLDETQRGLSHLAAISSILANNNNENPECLGSSGPLNNLAGPGNGQEATVDSQREETMPPQAGADAAEAECQQNNSQATQNGVWTHGYIKEYPASLDSPGYHIPESPLPRFPHVHQGVHSTNDMNADNWDPWKACWAESAQGPPNGYPASSAALATPESQSFMPNISQKAHTCDVGSGARDTALVPLYPDHPVMVVPQSHPICYAMTLEGIPMLVPMMQDPALTSTEPSRRQGQNRSERKSESKKHFCTLCDKPFLRPSSLTAHYRHHTGEKPYFCKFPGCKRGVAPNGFSIRSNMKRHMGQVHKGWSERQSSESTDSQKSHTGSSLSTNLGTSILGDSESLGSSETLNGAQQ